VLSSIILASNVLWGMWQDNTCITSKDQRIENVSKDIKIMTNSWVCKPIVKSQEIAKHETALVRCEGKRSLKRYDLWNHTEVQNWLSIEVSREEGKFLEND